MISFKGMSKGYLLWPSVAIQTDYDPHGPISDQWDRAADAMEWCDEYRGLGRYCLDIETDSFHFEYPEDLAVFALKWGNKG